MTTTLKALLANAVSLTITSANNLASAGAAGAAAIDNSTNLYIDAQMYLSIPIANAAMGDLKGVNIWFAGSEDGTNYNSTTGTNLDNYSGSDAAVTLQSPTVFRGPYFQPTPNNNLSTKIYIPSVLQFLGGLMLPRKWGIIVENRSNQAFNGQMTAEYSGLNFQNV